MSIPGHAKGRGTPTGITTGARTTTRTRILWGNGLTPSVRPSRVSAALWGSLTLADSPFLACSLEVSAVTRAPTARMPQTRYKDSVKKFHRLLFLSRCNGRACETMTKETFEARNFFAKRFQRETETGHVSTRSDFSRKNAISVFTRDWRDLCAVLAIELNTGPYTALSLAKL